MPGGARALAAVSAARPGLDARRLRLLTAVADTMVPRTDTPGAIDAGVPKLVDALLVNWASPERRTALLGALDRIDALAHEQAGKPFAALEATQRLALLGTHDAASLRPAPPEAAESQNAAPPPSTVAVGKSVTTVDPQVGRARQQPAQSVFPGFGPRVADPDYAKLKELIVVGYYCSQAALPAELPYEHSPGAWEPSLPVTPATRPWGGNALI